MIAVALGLIGCGEARTGGPGAAARGGESRAPDETGAIEAGTNDPAGIDALAREAQRFAARQAGGGNAANADADAGGAGANPVRWVENWPDDPDAADRGAPSGAARSTTDGAAESSPAPAPGADADEAAAPSVIDAETAPPPAAASIDAASMSRDELLDALASGIELADADSLRPWLARAALSVVDPGRELEADDLAPLSPEHRATVLAYQRTMAELGRSLGAGRGADHRALRRAAHELADQLDADQPLTIRNLKLCKRVKGFGVYETFERNAFLARREQPVIVYAELDHFAHRLEPDGRHAVELTQEVVLYNATDGLPVWRHKPSRIIDRSHNARRDFFIVQVIRLSPRLTVGKYRLKVTITDEIGQTVDEASIPLRIVAGGDGD